MPAWLGLCPHTTSLQGCSCGQTRPCAGSAVRDGLGMDTESSVGLWAIPNQKIPSPPAALCPAGRWGALGEQQRCGRASFPRI